MSRIWGREGSGGAGKLLGARIIIHRGFALCVRVYAVHGRPAGAKRSRVHNIDGGEGVGLQLTLFLCCRSRCQRLVNTCKPQLHPGSESRRASYEVARSAPTQPRRSPHGGRRLRVVWMYRRSSMSNRPRSFRSHAPRTGPCSSLCGCRSSLAQRKLHFPGPDGSMPSKKCRCCDKK